VDNHSRCESPGLDDVIAVEPLEQDSMTLRATVNGVEVGRTPLGAIERIQIDAGAWK
jgi:hypothetical protein